MQFKRVSKRIQVLAYRGYDNEKRRAVVKVVGSFDAYTYEIPAKLLENLSDEEKIELHNYIGSLKQQSSKQCEDILISQLSRDVVKVAGLILDESSNLSEQWGDEMWAALETMQKSLKKMGLKRPVKPSQPKSVNQQQVGLDLERQWDEAWTALEAVQKSLREVGLKRSVKSPKLKSTHQQQAGLDLGVE